MLFNGNFPPILFFPPVLFIHMYLLSHWVIDWIFGFPYPQIFLKIHCMLSSKTTEVHNGIKYWVSLTNQPMGRAHFIRKVLFSVKLGKHKISRLLSLWTSLVGQRWMTSHVCVYIAHKLVEITPTMQFYVLFYLTLLLSIIGEGNGTPLQYFCLENPMDGGAW